MHTYNSREREAENMMSMITSLMNRNSSPTTRRSSAIVPFVVIVLVAVFLVLVGTKGSGGAADDDKASSSATQQEQAEGQLRNSNYQKKTLSSEPSRHRDTNSNQKGNKLFEHIEGFDEDEYGEGTVSINSNSHAIGELKTSEVESYEWPQLSSLVNSNGKIIGDVQFTLDFAIVGHSKTGTTAQMNWLADHPEVQMYHHEVHSLKNGRPEELVELLYELPQGPQYQRAYKSPNDILSTKAMDAIYQYWPKTKLICGIRHPVKWFESYYNVSFVMLLFLFHLV